MLIRWLRHYMMRYAVGFHADADFSLRAAELTPPPR